MQTHLSKKIDRHAAASRRSQAGRLPVKAKKNLETIARVEAELLQKRSFAECLGECIAGFFGSMSFVVAHVLTFGTWIFINSGSLERLRPFDPYPFPLLCLVVGIEFIILTTFVLMNQKRQIRHAERWSHLQLQLSMLTEQEVTKSIQLLARVSRRLDLDGDDTPDAELDELSKTTPVSTLAKEIERTRAVGGEAA